MAWISDSSRGNLHCKCSDYLFIYIFWRLQYVFFFLYVYLCIVFISIRAGFFFFVCFFRCELNTCCQTFYCFLDYICSARLARTAEELQTSTRPASCSPQNSRTLHCSAFLSRSSFHHLSKQSVCSVRWKPCTAFSSGSVNFDQLWLS